VKRVVGGFLVALSALVMLVGTFMMPAWSASASVARTGQAQAELVTPVSSAATALAATRDARRQKSRVEILGARTAYSQSFANPDGTTTVTESAQPRWVRRGETWVAASADLVQAGDGGSWSPAAAEASLAFSGGGNAALATVRSGAYSMTVTWPSDLPAPSVSGPTATYRNVFPGVDLVLTAKVTGGFEDTLVIRDKAAAADPGLARLSLGLSLGGGLVQHVKADGSVALTTKAGQAVFASPAPSSWDSAKAGATAAGPATGQRPARVRADYGARSVRLSLPAGLTGQKFPVYLDPSYTVGPLWVYYGEIQSAYPTAAELNSTFDGKVSVGYDGGGVDRGNYIFALPSAATGGGPVSILSATMTGEVVTTYTSASVSHTVNLDFTGQYTSTSTWNSPPAVYAGPSAQTFTTTSTTPNQNVSWDVTGWIQADINDSNWQFSGELINNVESTDSTGTANFVEFSDNPTLSITYDHAPAAPSSISMNPQYWASDGHLYTSSAKPSFTATATDSDGDNVQYQAEILSGTTVVASGTSSSVTSGTPGTWTDTTTLTNGGAYSYQVRAYDGTEYGPWSYNQPFTVETDTPAAPTVTCSGYHSGTWTAVVAGGTTCSWTAPLTHMNGYVISLDGVQSWSTTTSTPINPGVGLHTLTVTPMSAAGVWGSAGTFSFGVGATGAMLYPADQSQTSTTVSLQAAAPAGYTSATFYYRYGTTGTFTAIPGATVYSCGCAVTWPVSTTTNAAGVQTALLSWYVTRVLANDGPVQVEATFTNSSGGNDTTPPVTVTLNRLGAGADYDTTQAGPVTVGLQSGNAALSATDVSIASYGSSLDVTRTFNSVQPAAASIFGLGWATSLTGGTTSAWTQLTNSTTYVSLGNADGSNDTFTKGTSSGSTVSWVPQGGAVTAGLTLTQNTSTGVFSLTEPSGAVTAFAQAATGGPYMPKTVTVPGGGNSAGFIYDTTSGDAAYGDPLQMVAPDAASSSPSTTACPYPASASTWTAGCRGLKFTYNTAGHVTAIDFVYVTNAGAYHDVAVADYGYDASGRLTTEWDPRLAIPLVNGYTYDETTSDADYGRITQVSPAQQAASAALAPWKLTYDDTSTDVNYGHLLTVARTHSATYGGGTATTTIDYSVPLTTAAGGPVNMDAATTATWGQADPPASAVATFPATHVPASPPTATDWQYATIQYYDANGRQVNTATYINGAWAVTSTQYDSYGNTTWALSAADRATALASSSPADTAATLASVNVYACDNFGTIGACTSDDQDYEVLTDSYGPAHNANVDGTVELERAHTTYGYDAGAPNSDTDAAGSPYMQVTSKTSSASVGVSIPGTSTADAQTTSYTYGNSSTSIGWTLGQPLTTTTDPGGLAVTSTAVFNTTSTLYDGANLQTGSYMPSDPAGGGTGDTETVYYTAGTNPVAAACGNEPEWANLTCRVGPAAQPGTTGLPSLPVTTYTYDDYLNQVTKTEAFGTAGTRTTTSTYDGAERAATQAITVTGTGMGTAVPKTNTVYSGTTGQQTDLQTLSSTGTVTADVSTGYDDFGNPLSYTDAAGNTTTLTYDIANRITTRNDGEGSQTLSYSASSSAPAQITDSQAGTFTATYNADGDVATQTYPGGITATYTYDGTGTASALSYSGPHWTAPLTETQMPDGSGDVASQAITDTAASLVASQAYGYDNDDRLTNVQDSVAGQCTTRSYGYDADSNRTSLTSFAPGGGGACQTSSGTTTATTYDSADRDTNAGYAYDTQGDVITTPSADAGGTGNLTATYYSDDMLASQAQGSNAISWTLDPTQGRFGTYTQGGVTYTDHYSDGGNSPTWISTSTGGWTRFVTDFNGALAAQVNASGTTLELPGLHGDVMATATTSPSSTGPAATYIYTEFGLPETSTPGIYGWLGSSQISSGVLGGQLLMGVRAYNPYTGKFAQVDPVVGGSASAYDYGSSNPVNQTDLTGRDWHWVGWAFGSTPWYGGKVTNAIYNIARRISFSVGVGVIAFQIKSVEIQLRWVLAVWHWYYEGRPTPWFYMYAILTTWIRLVISVQVGIGVGPVFIGVEAFTINTPAIKLPGTCYGWLRFYGDSLEGSGACGLV
jgi:RHS repeat-associated protein